MILQYSSSQEFRMIMTIFSGTPQCRRKISMIYPTLKKNSVVGSLIVCDMVRTSQRQVQTLATTVLRIKLYASSCTSHNTLKSLLYPNIIQPWFAVIRLPTIKSQIQTQFHRVQQASSISNSLVVNGIQRVEHKHAVDQFTWFIPYKRLSPSYLLIFYLKTIL